MSVAYSMDFRRAVTAHVEAGTSCPETARIFSTSRSFVIKLVRHYRETGDLAPRPRGGVPHSKLIAFQDEVIGWIEARLDITLQQMAQRLMDAHGVTASLSGLSDMLRRAGFTYKKITSGQRGYAWQAQGEA